MRVGGEKHGESAASKVTPMCRVSGGAWPALWVPGEGGSPSYTSLKRLIAHFIRLLRVGALAQEPIKSFGRQFPFAIGFPWFDKADGWLGALAVKVQGP